MKTRLSSVGAAIATIFLCAASDVGEPIQTGLGVLSAWGDWAEEYGVASGQFIAMHQGKVLAGDGDGAPMELASLSKSITAVCLYSLSQNGALALTDSLSALDAVDAAHPHATTTLEQLLTHSAGIWPDGTQADMPRWLGDPTPRHAEVAKRALDRAPFADLLGRFAYNNENYAILGHVIERVTGQPYAETCAAHAFPDGLAPDARLSPQSGAYAAWGGWQMPVPQFAAFVHHWFAPDAPLGQVSGDLPANAVDGAVAYGMGTFQRPYGDGHNFWHHGALCFAGHLNVGSFFALWENGFGVVAGYDFCPEFKDLLSLDQALARAAYGR